VPAGRCLATLNTLSETGTDSSTMIVTYSPPWRFPARLVYAPHDLVAGSVLIARSRAETGRAHILGSIWVCQGEVGPSQGTEPPFCKVDCLASDYSVDTLPRQQARLQYRTAEASEFGGKNWRFPSCFACAVNNNLIKTICYTTDKIHRKLTPPT
jgi:hypothetical protein